MPAERLSMRKIREVLRLHFEQKLTNRAIAQSVSVSPSTICDHLARAKAAGLTWPLDPSLDDATLNVRMFHDEGGTAKAKAAEPDCEYLRQELRRKGVTLMLLWQEYKQNHPEDGYQYSHFCERYRRYRSGLDVVLRQEHRAGEKTFVDFSGNGIPITNPDTGAVWEAPLFVAVLGASSYTYAEALSSQKEQHWVEGHIHAFEYFGGVTELLVPDNTKTAVSKACRYDPDLNRAYLDLARHYRTAIIPARAGKPRDKAKVESAVLVAQRWILAALRNHTFFSLQEANRAISEKLELLNTRKFEKLDTCRRDLFLSLDKPALRPLPTSRFEFAEWSSHTVHINYHIELDGHLYSVPYVLAQKRVEARRTHTTVEIFFLGRRVVSHRRSYSKGSATTLKEHMPDHHRQVVEWNPDRIRNWVGKAGTAAAKLADIILASKPHPELGYRACLGLVRLSKDYGSDRLDAACARAMLIGAPNYKSVKSILKTGLDLQPVTPDPEPNPRTPIRHENIRGPDYYQ